jgi:sarcosine oxidase, subunit beta
VPATGTLAAMSEAAEVVVVGGGVIGLSVARELRRAGGGRVVVLERAAAVGQGSSARAAGGVRAQFTTRINIEFSRHSIGELERLDRDTGLPGFRQTGYLLMTGSDDGERFLAEACALQRSLGVETRWLARDELLDMVPFVRRDGLRAGTFHARDGFLDPHGVVSALRLEAGRLGAEIVTGVEVSGIRRLAGGGFEVSAQDRSLRARFVVNAAGPEAAKVASLLAVDLPVAPVRRNLAYVRDRPGPASSAPAELIPMCVDLDTGVLVRREVGGGYLVAWSDPDDPPAWDTSLDPRFLEGLGERVGHRFPFLEDLPVDPRQCWAGLYPETPDHHAIIGEPPEAPGFVQCAGFGGHGVMHAPAAGRAVAELLTLGRCTSFDLRPLRPSRFAEGDLVIETAVL